MTSLRLSIRYAIRSLGLAVLVLSLNVGPAIADAEFHIELTRDATLFPTVYRDDERVDYKVSVSNVSGSSPGPGDDLTCDALGGGAWFNSPTFTFKWLRDGDLVNPVAVSSGGTTSTYIVQPADEGHSIQCVVVGANAGGAAASFTLPRSITPVPTTPSPPVFSGSGNPRPTVALANGGAAPTGVRVCSTPASWVGPAFGTATTTSGSNQLTAVSGPHPFAVGQEIAGVGIPAGATITAVGSGTLTLSANATVSGTGVAVSAIAAGTGTTTAGSNIVTTLVTAAGTGTTTAGSTAVTALSMSVGRWVIGLPITGANIAPGTTVAAVSGSTLTLSQAATASGSSPLASNGPLPFAVGQEIAGAGIPAGTTITTVGSGSLTLSANATASASGVYLSGATAGKWAFQWLRNGEAIGGATASMYTPVAADTATNLQCMVTGRTGTGGPPSGGTIFAISNNSVVPTPSPTVPNNNGNTAAGLPSMNFSNSTTGPVTVELELPSGLETRAHAIVSNGWACNAFPPAGVEPAKVVCSRNDPLQPGNSYLPIEVQTALGDDAPDTAVAKATVSGGGVADPASATVQFVFAPARGFGIKAFETIIADEAGDPYTQAGGHPYSAGTRFTFNGKRGFPAGAAPNPLRMIDSAKTIIVDAPRGFAGNALAIKELCPSTEDVIEGSCPPESIVGGIDLEFSFGDASNNSPIYAITPEFGRPAQFAFTNPATNAIYVFFPRLRPEDGYAISFESAPIPTEEPKVMGADVTLCGFGANVGGNVFLGCRKASDVNSNPKSLITLPTRCEGPPPTSVLRVDSWQNPGDFKSLSFSDPSTTGCDRVDFEPQMELVPTSHRADSPTGMDVEIFMPTDGLESKTDIAQANLKRVTVTLPEGMAVNASAGHGLTACTADQVGIDSATGVPSNAEARCPDSSKIGTIGITTPLIESTLTGDVFIAKQGRDNPFDSNIALYMVFSSKRDGITIKVAGEVKPDPVTGQMSIVFDDNPEAPFSSVQLHFPQGPRSPLLNPPRCGTYEIVALLTPWSAKDPDNPTAKETVEQTSTYEVDEGPNGGPCPDGRLDPKLSAGTTDPIGGKTSPFVMRLWRDDGTQRFTGLELSPPLGLTAYLKGVKYCPDEVLASISPAPETGQAQIDNPSCPASSHVGRASAGAGAGSDPFYVETGKVYLAGPYKGAPVSLAVVTPAVAGPLDLGNVVIRTALYVNSKTAQITAVSDRVPTILHGILLDIRDIRVAIDRPNFTLNPTNCEQMSVGAKVTGDGGGTAEVSNRFQVTDCAALGFKPRMSLQLKGGTKRGDNPALKAVVRPRPGDANIGRASVTLPRSAFLDQAHIRTVCTRVQFAADRCPKGAIYGRAEAITPLLDEPLKGPVYLRSSNNKLPDLVADLRGPASQPIKVEAAFRTDSIKGGIRSTLDVAPDAPVTKFTLQMQGGKKGLVINSRDLCANPSRATARMVGQNGRRYDFRTPVVATKCAKQRKGKRN